MKGMKDNTEMKIKTTPWHAKEGFWLPFEQVVFLNPAC